MDFTQVSFLVFVTVLAAAYRIAPARLRVALLVAASYAFYCTWSGQMALLLLGATVAAFLAARAIERARSDGRKRAVMLAAVSGLVALLALFKSAAFLRPILHHDLLMPLGISYYTFKLISYVVDVYWGTMAAETNFLAFAAYGAFFPQIVAGPIQRSQSFLAQLHKPKPAGLDTATLGLQRIVLGFFKKLVVADNLALLVNFIYGHVHAAGTPLLVGYYVYPFQLYADFSALTDIAIGAALLVGIESPENFNAPFAAPNPSEFWRRWHITLTSWLTDYVFTPLRMGSRAWGNAGLVLSLTATFFLIGIWHGFRWRFALFGLVHAVYLSIDALTMRARKRYYKTHPAAGRWTDWLGPVVMFHLAAAAFVVFRAASVGDAFYLLGHMGQGWSALSPEFLRLMEFSGVAIWAGMAGYLVLEIADYLRRHNQHNELLGALPRWGRWSVYCCTAVTVVVMIILLMGSSHYSPFIYEVF
jgi:alginate O-acetyltransferase complex protein AlgI